MTQTLDLTQFEPFPKIARLFRECVITEKLDGTNAQVIVQKDGTVTAASRSRIITPEQDNFGFAKWAAENSDELRELGVGRHYGEWWGNGIQRGYGLKEKRFSLFNVERWKIERPSCCDVVPTLFAGRFETTHVEAALETLRANGSQAAPGFANPEGVIIWHTKARQLFKVTLERDDEWKGKAA